MSETGAPEQYLLTAFQNAGFLVELRREGPYWGFTVIWVIEEGALGVPVSIDALFLEGLAQIDLESLTSEVVPAVRRRFIEGLSRHRGARQKHVDNTSHPVTSSKESQ